MRKIPLLVMRTIERRGWIRPRPSPLPMASGPWTCVFLFFGFPWNSQRREDDPVQLEIARDLPFSPSCEERR